MVKIVDHEEKRRTIVKVTAYIIASEGMGAVTTRRIASETGCSLGILSHYFANKDEIVLGALNWCDARINEQLGEMYSEDFLSLDHFRDLFLMLLPLDEVSDTEWRVRINFVAHALTHPELKQLREENLKYSYDIATKFVEKLQSEGGVRTDISAESLATNAVDMAFGLCVNLLNYPLRERRERVNELLDALLKALLV